MNQSIIGILWMVLTTILFVGVTATVRYLEGEVPAPQAAFLRYAIGTLFLIPSLISLTKIKPDKPLLQKFVLRPGFKVIDSGQLGMLMATVVFTVSYLIAKIVSKERSSSEIVAMLSIFTTIFLIPSAIYSWEPLSIKAFLILSFTALIATVGHITMTKAIKAAPMVVTQPILFLQLVWASMVGLFIFNEKFDPFVILGGTIIMLCVCYVSYREHILGKKITSDALQKVI